MPQVLEGAFQGAGFRFALIVGRFNRFISERLLEGALDMLRRHGVAEEDITVVWCPGAFEIPLVAQRLARSRKHHAILALGAVIRGATPHFDLVAQGVANGIARVSLEEGVPVIFGVLTTDTVEQAMERAGTKAGNKGADAALAALEMAHLLAQLA